MFGVGTHFPPSEHKERITRYRENKKIFKGDGSIKLTTTEESAFDILEKYHDTLTSSQTRTLRITTNLAGIICKKSADFLFGENPVYSAGLEDDSNEQKAIERWVHENELNITNYESALGNAYRGDSFYKVRWGQEHNGLLPVALDPFRVIIESQNAEFVFPETYATDTSRIYAYHVAVPVEVDGTKKNEWVLKVESHYPGLIVKQDFFMKPTVYVQGDIPTEWRIYGEASDRTVVETSIPFPLVVHVPNYSTDDSWEGIDDISEHKTVLAEINSRLSLIAEILDKHADPAMIVPQGTLVEDENGQPSFRVGIDKVFEVGDKSEVEPKYVTWNGQIESAFREIEKLLDLLLMSAEIPQVALGAGDSGTSGSSGLAIKWRLNSLLAKINRKRQYYDKGLKRIFTIAQLLEHDRKTVVDYELFQPTIKFKDGLPEDEMEKANIMALRTGGKATISTKRAIMEIDGLTEEQAQKVLDEIEAEEESMMVDPTAFQMEDPLAVEPDEEEEEIDQEEEE
jgi:Phage portal protein, SPP1 Gp6-like